MVTNVALAKQCALLNACSSLNRYLLLFFLALKVFYSPFCILILHISLVFEIQEWLFLVKCRGHCVSLCWVPAHAGITRNEHADQLVKAAVSPLETKTCSLPFQDMFPVIQSYKFHVVVAE